MLTSLSDIEQIVEIVTDYYLGMYEADVERLKKTFTSEALIVGFLKGQKAALTVDQFCEYVANAHTPEAEGRKCDVRIESLDISETSGMVKVKDLYQGLIFTDYLSLIKQNGSWLISHKTFEHENP